MKRPDELVTRRTLLRPFAATDAGEGPVHDLRDPSVRVLRRLGMKKDRTSDDGTSGTAFFVLRRDDWLAAPVKIS